MNDLTEAERNVLQKYKSHLHSGNGGKSLRGIQVTADWPADKRHEPSAAILSLVRRGWLLETSSGTFTLTEAGEEMVKFV